MTTVDPVTGDKGVEPLRTLAGYRREDGKVWFGMNLVPDAEGWVRVGDAQRGRVTSTSRPLRARAEIGARGDEALLGALEQVEQLALDALGRSRRCGPPRRRRAAR